VEYLSADPARYWAYKHFFIEHDAPWLSHPDDPEAEFKTATAGIQYLETVTW
jgi:hypothetical protein